LIVFCLSKIEAQYWNLGHVRVAPRQREPTDGEDTRLDMLLTTIEENPVTPARQLTRDNDISLGDQQESNFYQFAMTSLSSNFTYV
jgi:hypothetical protein